MTKGTHTVRAPMPKYCVLTVKELVAMLQERNILVPAHPMKQDLMDVLARAGKERLS